MRSESKIQNLERHTDPSMMYSIARFFVLYFTTLFSLDTVSAARSSPFSISNPQIPESMRRGRSDYGEGHSIGYRLDPGGPATRRGGFNGGGSASDINIPACKNCPTNAAPKLG
ncbi:uncharacterized protein PV09_01744 [Verruconis gallopava]|uniref:Uncharacterized protein n=1 Tax=Verruconis gallopava TaxID=253628 RepID=A0A0D1XYE3_9PEZI|nr:uncharacterized protein PV09_01744 [Verruconis gallopava]KIW07826.1 hypothetical protein PV09_01744 [Verruconis gallopava]